MVALEVAYDYLDALTEAPETCSVENGLALHAALADSVGARTGTDYYQHHPQQDDGGYLERLAATCRDEFAPLPSAGAVGPVARDVMVRCGEAQTRAHAVVAYGTGQLHEWAETIDAPGLLWWEAAAGAAASVIAVHAQIALAAESTATAESARALAAAYLPVCAMITMLDSVLDYDRDREAGDHNFAAHYPSKAIAASRIIALAAQAEAASTAIRAESRYHHLLLIAGAVAFYLSGPETDPRLRRYVLREIPRSMRLLAVIITAVFRLWRWAT